MVAPLAEVIRKVPASSQGSVVLGLGGSTITSAWTVQLPISKTRSTPSTVWVNFVGFPLVSNVTGVKVKVVPAWPLTTPAWAGTVVVASAAHANASVRGLNRLSLVIRFFLSFSEDRPFRIVVCFGHAVLAVTLYNRKTGKTLQDQKGRMRSG